MLSSQFVVALGAHFGYFLPLVQGQDDYIRETVNGKVRGFSWDPTAEYAEDLYVSDNI